MFPQEELIKLYRISKPDIKENSIIQYIRVLRNYHKLVNLSDDWIDWNWIKFNEHVLKDVSSLSSKRNYYNSILPLIKSFSIQKIPGTENLDLLQEQVKYGTAIQNLNKNVKELSDNNIISDKKLEKHHVNFRQVEEFVDELRLKKQYQNSLLLFLMSEYKFRNEISSFKWISLKDFNKKTSHLKDLSNYIVIGSKRMFISRGQFKTDKVHGRTETEIENKKLRSDIKKYIKTLDDDIMFKNNKGEMYSNADLSQKIGRLTKDKFGVSLGTSSINALYLESLDNDTMNKLKELSKNRGTSIGVLVSHYFNDI